MKIVVSDCDHDSMNEERQVFEKAGLTFEHLACKTEGDLVSRCKGAAIVMNQYAPFTKEVFAALAPELKMIVRYGVGVNNVDLDAATEAGVQVCNVPDYGMNEVSDQTVAMTMALARKVVMMNERTKKGEWDYALSVPLFRLAEQTIGLVGMGRNGRLFADKMRAFGCRMIGYDKYYTPNAKDGSDYIQAASLEEVIATSDIIAINCPLTDETRNLFSTEAFKKMKNTAYIVNTARGGIIDEAALADALENGEIAGAALDVLDKEPLAKDSPLIKYDNCLITPHMAWYSEQAALELKRKVAEEAVRFAKGEPLRNPVNTLG